ncbi:MAG: hypothetical protein FRX49_04758 [Trebouxia sp. A1-2]|nr:MAG: hypothetical protein FRX49_04758 [Trebouxia sp. A1-2]
MYLDKTDSSSQKLMFSTLDDTGVRATRLRPPVKKFPILPPQLADVSTYSGAGGKEAMQAGLPKRNPVVGPVSNKYAAQAAAAYPNIATAALPLPVLWAPFAS